MHSDDAGQRSIPRTAKASQTRDALVDAAVVHFARNDVHRSSLSDIAEIVGLSPATVHRYFDRRRLFWAAVERDAEGFVGRLSGLVNGAEQPALGLRSLGDGLAAAVVDFPLVCRVLAGKEFPARDEVMRLAPFVRWRDELATVVAAWAADGRVRTGVDARRAALAIETVVIDRVAGRVLAAAKVGEPDEAWTSVVELLAAALGKVRPADVPPDAG